MAAIRCGMRSVTAYPAAPAPLCRTSVNGTPHASQDTDAEQAYGLALLHLLDS